MKRTLLFTMTLMGGCGAMLALSNPGDRTALAPKLDVDPTPPLRSGPLGGYAETVDKVSPSVVSIFTSREATQPERFGGGQVPPGLFDSPLFRDFFGDRGIDPRQFEGRAPRSLPDQKGLGSGVILSPDGFILTNNHVVERASDIQVRLDGGEEYEAEIVATDPASDLAVIKVEASDLPAATIGDSDVLKPGDTVLAIGSPFGLNHTVTHGIVSATGRDNLNITGYEDFIQTDASINPGNSGGALVDNRGRVVGINTAILSRTGGNVGIGFAIPVNMAVEIASELIDNGGVDRGYLGVTLGPLSRELSEALDVDSKGVLVNEVMPETPASEAGFKAGDVIVAVNGKPVEDVADVRRLVGREKPGSDLTFKVSRGPKKMTLEARIAKMPSDRLAGSPAEASPDAIEEGRLAGVRLAALDESLRQRIGLDATVEGVAVLEVDPGSDAAGAGLEAGMVITEIDRSLVTSPKDAYARAGAVEEGKPTLLRVTDGRGYRFIAIG